MARPADYEALKRLAAAMAASHREHGEAALEDGEQMIDALKQKRIPVRPGDPATSVDFEEAKARVRKVARAAGHARPAKFQAETRERFEERGREWPFTVPGGIVSGHAGGAIAFWTPDGVGYGLNGPAQEPDGLGLPNSEPIKCATLGWVTAIGHELVQQAQAEEA